MSRLPSGLATESAYQEAIRSLLERINYEKVGHAPYSTTHYRLDRMRRVLSQLGDPHLAVPVIHVAGTKGKGSTATFLSSLLTAAGFRTGLYTSPHLLRLEERFRIDNQPASSQQLVQLVHDASQAADAVERDGGGRATFFELTTAIAFLYFAQMRTQAVVLEVGLGGRLDSTNVCQPCLCIITSIGLDHQAQLGNTITQIAGEKAGIIKTGVPVICSARHPDARQTIARMAEAHNAPLQLIERDFDCSWQTLPTTQPPAITSQKQMAEQQPVVAEILYQPHYTPSLFPNRHWPVALLGPHQADNLSAALCAVDALIRQGWSIPLEPLPKAVATTVVPARLQVVGHAPWRLIDCAHNPDSIAATLAALDQHFPHARRTLILATSRDKDTPSMLRLLAGRCDKLIVTQYHNNPRGLPIPEILAAAQQALPDNTVLCSSAPSPVKAWQQALNSASESEVICATGSFFQAAELLESVENSVEKSMDNSDN